jgi:hypothetical protein
VDEVSDTVAEKRLSLSDLLLTLGDGEAETVSVDAIVAHFGRRAFGAVLFIFSIPNLLPLPPGSSTFLSLPLLILAPQLAVGRPKPWIPRWLGKRTVGREALRHMAQRVVPWLERAERMTTPRLSFMFGRMGDVSIGVVCTLLAAVLILPIPLGNLLPAAAVAALALSLIQRDGILTLIGYATAAISIGVLVVSGRLVMAALYRLEAMLGLL